MTGPQRRGTAPAPRRRSARAPRRPRRGPSRRDGRDSEKSRLHRARRRRSTASPRSSRVVVASASPPSSSSATATARSASATARPRRCPRRSPRASRRPRRPSSGSRASRAPSRTRSRVRRPPASSAAPGRARYRCHRRWPGARRARVRRHPRRAEQVARLVQPDQHRPRDGRGAAHAWSSPRPSPPAVACAVEDVAPAALLRRPRAAERPTGRAGWSVVLMPRLKVTQTRVRRSAASATSARRCARLGLKRIGDVVVKEDRPEIRGMVQHRAAPRRREGRVTMATRRGRS